MVVDNPLLGTVLHSFGAMCAALCYTPQQKLRGWTWQTYWLTQAAICWLIGPIIGALLTIPNIWAVLSQAPRQVMVKVFCLGVVYGIGGTAFGLSIRHIGYSLTYAIAIGISCVLGTLTGPILKGTLVKMLDKPGAEWVLGGIAVGTVGMALCGLAGRLKELDLKKDQGTGAHFSLAKGLPLCLLAGVLSGIYGIAINDVGGPLALAAAEHGAGYWQTNIVYVFVNSGAFLTTFVYTLYLSLKQKTTREFIRLESGPASHLAVNYLLAILTGCLWYSQFLFYGLGHVRMGSFKFSSWAIHMILLILFSTAAGLAMREWIGCRRKTHWALIAALVVLIAAVLALTYGNHLGEAAARLVEAQ